MNHEGSYRFTAANGKYTHICGHSKHIQTVNIFIDSILSSHQDKVRNEARYDTLDLEKECRHHIESLINVSVTFKMTQQWQSAWEVLTLHSHSFTHCDMSQGFLMNYSASHSTSLESERQPAPPSGLITCLGHILRAQPGACILGGMCQRGTSNLRLSDSGICVGRAWRQEPYVSSRRPSADTVTPRGVY